jgi:hypothetical protein
MKKYLLTFLVILSALIINEGIWRYLDRKTIENTVSEIKMQKDSTERKQREKVKKDIIYEESRKKSEEEMWELNQQRELERREKNAANFKSADK